MYIFGVITSIVAVLIFRHCTSFVLLFPIESKINCSLIFSLCVIVTINNGVLVHVVKI